MDFLSDLEKQLEIDLRQVGCKVPKGATVDKLLHSWFDYESRTISRARRTIKKSAEFIEEEKKLSSDHLGALKTIVGKLENADDLTPHLSKGVLNSSAPDYLMADWRIHHIHISDTKKRPKQFFVDRSDLLAFVLIAPREAYFIRILPHDQKHLWADKALLQTVQVNWPQLLKPYARKGRLEPDVSITDEVRIKLRKNAINVPTQLGNTLIFNPGGGISSDGTPTAHVLKANAITNTLKMITEYLNGYPDVQTRIKVGLGIAPDKVLDLRLVWKRGQIFIQEQTTKKYLGFDMKVVRNAVAELIRQQQLRIKQLASKNKST
jgi:hypothetical protein